MAERDAALQPIFQVKQEAIEKIEDLERERAIQESGKLMVHFLSGRLL